MRTTRQRLLALGPDVTAAGLVITGAVLPAVAWPLVGLGIAALFGLSSKRHAVGGSVVGLAVVAGSLPMAETATQRIAIAAIVAWTGVAMIGWERAIRARRAAEAVIDTVLLATGRQWSGRPAGTQLIAALTDILGGTNGRLDPYGSAPASGARWEKATRVLQLPLASAGRRMGIVTIRGVSRPASWQLALAELVAQRWADQAAAIEASEHLLRPEAIDPITGLGNELAVAAGMATLVPGDSVIALRLEDLDVVRDTDGDGRADLLICQLGLHVRNRLRSTDTVARYGEDRFVVICRNPKGETPAIVDRVLSAWPVWEAGRRLLAMFAVHQDGRSPIETLDSALDPVGHSTAIDLIDDGTWAASHTFARQGEQL